MKKKKTVYDFEEDHKNSEVAVAVPEVCEASSPIGPISIPHQNTASATDASMGSKTVKLDGKEAMVKGSSKYAKSTGDEPPHDSSMGTVSLEQRSPTSTIKRIVTLRTLGIP